MELVFIIIGVFVLYARTWLGKNRSFYLIDDNVRRWGYLYDVPDTLPNPNFYSQKPHPWRYLFLSITHALNVWVVGMLFGWQVALLFAFSPISVNGTAWLTGGYYAVTTFLCLTAFYFVTTFPSLFGALVGSLFFTAGLGSTITALAIPFMFLFVGTPWGLIFFWPLIMYVGGKRFRFGFDLRNSGKKDKVHWRKIVVAFKVVACYIRINLFPNRLCFFRQFGADYTRKGTCKKDMETVNNLFWFSVLLVIVFTVAGWMISPLGTVWFLCCVGIFSQYKVLGQFIAERYLYMANVGICIIWGTLLANSPVLLAILATLYVYRTHIYIPAFHDQESLYKNGIVNDPKCVSNYCNLGERWLHVHENVKAFRILSQALEMDPESFLAETNLAAYFISVKHYQRAKYHTERAIQTGDCEWIFKVLYKQDRKLAEIIIKDIKRFKEYREKGWEDVESVRSRDAAGQGHAVLGSV